MDNKAFAAIQAVNNGQLSYCKFLSANDTGETGAHQAGIYIAKNAVSIHDLSYPPDHLIFLAAKTTCKDRW